ncbi:plant glycogenin starch initiation protein [Salix suchowensis]|nr:plant glycogenin starch initiation protein [Salix suchowensis]
MLYESHEKLGERNDYQGVGLLNFNNSEISYWKHLMPDATHVALQLDYADKNMTWDSLYPEWIDEEQEKEVPVCPSLPKPETLRKRLDLIAVKLPCRNEVNWSRDVARLHLQLAAASLAASAKGLYPIHLLFITERFPIPNLFTCKELVVREGMFGYTSLISQLDLVNFRFLSKTEERLEKAGWKIRTIQRIRNPKAEKDAYNEWNYSKFRLWQLTDYDKIIFIDADLLILRNIDFLFGMPEISATGNNATFLTQRSSPIMVEIKAI